MTDRPNSSGSVSTDDPWRGAPPRALQALRRGAAARRAEPERRPEFGFTGQRFEAGQGIYDYGARFYDPAFGRFLQPDALVQDAFDPQEPAGSPRAPVAGSFAYGYFASRDLVSFNSVP